MLDGELPSGLQLKKVGGNYIIEGYANKHSISSTEIDDVDVKGQKGFDELVNYYLGRQLQFREVEYVDGPYSNVVVSSPPTKIAVGDSISKLDSNHSRDIKKIVEFPEIILTVNEFDDDGLGSFDFEDGSLVYTNSNVSNERYENLSWYGYLKSSSGIYLR